MLLVPPSFSSPAMRISFCSGTLLSRRVLFRPDLQPVGRYFGLIHRHQLQPSTTRPSSFPPPLQFKRGCEPVNWNSPLQNSRAMSSSSPSSAPAELRFANPAILICDIQEKFRNAIYEFDKIVLTTQKLLHFSKAFSVPVITTTQTSAKLGPTVRTIADLLPATPYDKTRFSMCIPPIVAELSQPSQIALVGIESHICITQTALDMRDAGHKVYVIADGVSSCNPGEVGVALDRLRSEPGITVTSSESWMYECVGDASHPGFKGLINVVKGSMAETKKVWGALPPGPKI